MKIAVCGYGRMGHAVERVAGEAGHEVVAIIGNHNDPHDSLDSAEVLIDFSHASALDRVLDLACGNGLDLVIGTTGWNERIDHVRARIDEAKIGAGYASNFSPGANVVFAMARRARELLAPIPQYAA